MLQYWTRILVYYEKQNNSVHYIHLQINLFIQFSSPQIILYVYYYISKYTKAFRIAKQTKRFIFRNDSPISLYVPV